VSKPPRHNRRNRARLIAIGRKPAIELPQHNLGRKPNMIENRKLPSRRKVIKAMGVGAAGALAAPRLFATARAAAARSRSAW
jgi:hypothetical protein